MCFVIQSASAGTAGSGFPEPWSPCARAVARRTAAEKRARILAGLGGSAFRGIGG